eukprot:1143617-Pelagomonas_calceolata.AAC.9
MPSGRPGLLWCPPATRTWPMLAGIKIRMLGAPSVCCKVLGVEGGCPGCAVFPCVGLGMGCVDEV